MQQWTDAKNKSQESHRFTQYRCRWRPLFETPPVPLFARRPYCDKRRSARHNFIASCKNLSTVRSDTIGSFSSTDPILRRGNTARSVGCRTAKLTGQIKWLIFALAAGGGFCSSVLAPEPREQLMENVRDANLFKNVLVSVRFPT
jgi:hypothetical protein